MRYIGIDLHSNNFTCCIIDDVGMKTKCSFNLNPASLEKFYELLDKETVIMVEASTNTFRFIELFQERVKSVYVANTHKLKLISMVKKKTDKIDAEKLAIFIKMQISSGEELIKSVYIPEKDIQNLRSLFTTYKLTRKQIGSIKNRIHSILKQNLHPFTKEYIFGKRNREIIRNLIQDDANSFQINYLMNQMEYLETSILEIEKIIMIIGSKYYSNIDILTSMKGISVMTAIAIIADIATVERFPNSKHFTSYLRSAPGVDNSNESTRITSTNKAGRKLSITLLSQSLNHFRDSDPKTRRWYDKNVTTKNRGKLRMAICRRILSEIYQILKKGEYHYSMDSNNHSKKMLEYDKFLQAHGVIFKLSA